MVEIYVIILLYTILLILSFFRTNILFFELVASFMPYSIVLNLLFLGTLTFLFVSEPKTSSSIILFAISVVLLTITFLLMSMWIYRYTFVKPLQKQGTKQLTIAFVNIHFDNTNYEKISTIIKELNPDIVGIAEIGNKERMAQPLSSQYPFTQFLESKNFTALALFSKYPLMPQKDVDKLTFAIATSMVIASRQIPLYVIHPYPPISQKALANRDKELFMLSSRTHQQKEAIILGDFNLTPWSYTFTKLLNSMNNIKSAAQGHGIHFTWGYFVMKTTIDHILVPNSFEVKSFRSKSVLGSDHKLIYSKIAW